MTGHTKMLHAGWLALVVIGGARSAHASPVPDDVLKTAERLRDAALKDRTAYRLVEELTTEVGPRLAGTEEEARARAWAVRALRKLGFSDRQISVEPFEMKTWVRGQEDVRITAPYPQQLIATALGSSASTGARGLKGELVVFRTLDELKRVKPGALNGKIAYIGHAMTKTQDGSSYGFFGAARFTGPGIAAKKGAAAVMIRSIGTHHHRLPHTGLTSWPKGQAPIPAVAVSPPDADQIERITRRNQKIEVSMVVTPRMTGTAKSGNVVVDVEGSTRKKEIVIVGGHLDSWDLGTGAVDDGAGVALTTAAVHLIQELGLRPKRTIRLVMWGAEEVGLFGAKDYVRRHKDEIPFHVLGSESDFGAERVYRIDGHLSAAGVEWLDEMVRILAPVGVARGQVGATFEGWSGPDLSPLNAKGMPRFRLAQDGTDYFDLHHTPDDTFDKIDPQALAQNVATYAVFVWLAANSEIDFKPSAEKKAGGVADGSK